jgi:hypothetical protein
MDGYIPDTQVTGQGEFYSRSAGYLSFVDSTWDKDDLAREMGVKRHRNNDRDDPPVTPRDFPDKSLLQDMERQSEGGAEVDLSDAEDYKEMIPHGLPRDFESYYPLRLHGCDYLVAKTNDGRLDLREIMLARRREDGNFAGEAERVDTSALADMAPAYYHEVSWTERDLQRKEKFIANSELTEFDTLIENTTKVYLVFADSPFDEMNAYNRKLDFTKPVVSLDNTGGCVRASVRGAEEAATLRYPVLVIRDEGREMYVRETADLADWETVCVEHEEAVAMANKDRQGPDLNDEFLKEVDNNYVPDDTPEVDNF